MPSPRQPTRPEKSLSFHGMGSEMATRQLRRPKTLPNLPPAPAEGVRPKLTKLLLNVTIQGSLGGVQVVVNPDSTVGDLIAAAVRLYVKEGRRPVLPSSDPALYDLHYSQFSLERLDRDEKLAELGSRNFFLCKTKADATTKATSCSEEATASAGHPWLKLIIGFLQ